MLCHTARARPVLGCSPLLSRQNQRGHNGYKHGYKHGYKYRYKCRGSHVQSHTNSIHLPRRPFLQRGFCHLALYVQIAEVARTGLPRR